MMVASAPEFHSMKSRPRLLFLCQTLPFPPDGGVNIRTYNVLRLLARSFDITALCFYRWKRGQGQRDVNASLKALGTLCTIEAFPIDQEHSRPRLLWDHVRSLLTGRPYTVFTYESRRFRGRLRELLQEQDFDLVHMDSLDLSGYLPELGDLPVVCVHHNVESALLKRRAGVEDGAWRRMYVGHQASLTEREERRWCSRVNVNIAVSSEDASLLSKLVPGCEVAVVPNGVDTDHFQPSDQDGEGMVFVGGTTWFPNQDALSYFSESILGRIRDLGSTDRVVWVGRSSPGEREHYADACGIQMTGYVDDVRPYIADSACYVVPLRVGGGTRLKILDAWAMGKAVVSTSIGCEGLAAVDGVNIIIRDSPEDFAQAVNGLLQNPALRLALGNQARRTAEERYSWNVIGEVMNERYLTLVDMSRVGGADKCEAAPVAGN